MIIRRKNIKQEAQDHKKYLLLSTRYLDAYEKYYFLGEEEDDDSNLFYDEEDQRTRRQRALRVVQSVPSTYNEGQHRIAGGQLLRIAIFGLKICLSKEEIVL